MFLKFRGTARWGSSCSGTESPAFCLRELWQELEREKPGCTLLPVRTVVSCKKIAEKRDFIERTAPYCADASYGDIFDLCKSTAPFPKDTRTKKQLQPSLQQVVLYCGLQLQDRQWFELCRYCECFCRRRRAWQHRGDAAGGAGRSSTLASVGRDSGECAWPSTQWAKFLGAGTGESHGVCDCRAAD